MSLELALQANTEAVNALVAALKAGGTVGAAGATTTTTADDKPKRGRPAADKTKDTAAAPKNTVEQVKAAAVRLKDEKGTVAAKALIKKHGAEELAKLKPETYDAFVAEVEEMLKPEGEAGDDDGDDDSGL